MSPCRLNSSANDDIEDSKPLAEGLTGAEAWLDVEYCGLEPGSTLGGPSGEDDCGKGRVDSGGSGVEVELIAGTLGLDDDGPDAACSSVYGGGGGSSLSSF